MSYAIYPIYCFDRHIFFGNKMFSQIIGIPIGTNCATLIADFESELMAKLQKNLSKQSLI